METGIAKARVEEAKLREAITKARVEDEKISTEDVQRALHLLGCAVSRQVS